MKMTLKLRRTIIKELSSKREYISRFHGPSIRKYHAQLRLSRASRFVSEGVFSFRKRYPQRMQAPFNLIQDITVNVLVPGGRRPRFYVKTFHGW